MSSAATVTLLREDWTKHPLGNLRRDNTARGEYTAQVVPQDAHGWYHNARIAETKGDRSSFRARRTRGGRAIEQPDASCML